MEILKINNLSFSYEGSEKKVLDNIDLSINKGEVVLISGASGCGKTTLLKYMKKEFALNGDTEGIVKFCGIEMADVEDRISSSKIGYVMQNPDSQIVTDKVFNELALGLENLGIDNKTMKIRIAEMANFFGIQSWFRKSVSELSGGQKQLLNLASVMVMQPDVLILDESTSQLDPIADGNFIDTVVRINRELSTTVIITEQHPTRFFLGNTFYTTAAARMSRDVFDNAVTCKDVAELCMKNMK